MLGPRTESYDSQNVVIPESEDVYVERGERLAKDKEYNIDELVNIARSANIKWYIAVEKTSSASKDEIDKVDAYGEAEVALQAVHTAWRRLPKSARRLRQLGERES